jgi:hypothetical protein
VAEDKNYRLPIYEGLTYEDFKELVVQESVKYGDKIKAFIKTQKTGQALPKYLKLDKEAEVTAHIRFRKEPIVVEFFYQNKQDTIRRMVSKINEALSEKEKDLRNLTDKLKD